MAGINASTISASQLWSNFKSMLLAAADNFILSKITSSYVELP